MVSLGKKYGISGDQLAGLRVLQRLAEVVVVVVMVMVVRVVMVVVVVVVAVAVAVAVAQFIAIVTPGERRKEITVEGTRKHGGAR